MRLSDEERAELQSAVLSKELRADGARLRAAHADAFITGGVVDCDRVIDFLIGYNEFVAGVPRLRRVFVEREMKL